MGASTCSAPSSRVTATARSDASDPVLRGGEHPTGPLARLRGIKERGPVHPPKSSASISGAIASAIRTICSFENRWNSAMEIR